MASTHIEAMAAVSDTAGPGAPAAAVNTATASATATSIATTTAIATAAATAAAARNHALNSQTGAWSSSSFVEDPSSNTVGPQPPSTVERTMSMSM